MPTPSDVPPVTVVNYVRRPDAGGKFIVLVPTAGPVGGVLAVFSDFTQETMHDRILSRWRAEAGPSRPDLRVEGGGWWKYDPRSLRLELYGSSAAFGPYRPSRLAGLRPGLVFREREIVHA